MTDDLTVVTHDPEAEQRGDSPRKAYFEKFSDVPDELDEPTLFELRAINRRTVMKRFKDSEPKEVTELGFALVMLDENKQPIMDAEKNLPFAVEHVVTQPKPLSYEFFKNTGLFKFFKELKLEITEEMQKNPIKLALALPSDDQPGLRMRLMVEIREGVGKKSGKAWRAPHIKAIQAPKDKADIDHNKKLLDAIFAQ